MIIRPTHGIIGGPQGDSRWNVFLPPAPTGLSGVAGNGQVVLSWTAPTVIAQTPITGYVVQYSSDSGGIWATFSGGVGASSPTTVSGLQNGTAYVFRVAAVNAIGQGAWSNASESATPASDPPIILSGDAAFITGGTLNGTWVYAGTYNDKSYYTKQIQWSADGQSYDALGYMYYAPSPVGWYISGQLGRTSLTGVAPSLILFYQATDLSNDPPVFGAGSNGYPGTGWFKVAGDGNISTVLG